MRPALDEDMTPDVPDTGQQLSWAALTALAAGAVATLVAAAVLLALAL